MTGAGLLAALSAAAAAALWLTGGARVGSHGAGGAKSRARVPTVLVWSVLLGGLVLLSPRLAVVAGLVGGLAAGVARLVRASRAIRRADALRGRVVEMCDALQAELAAGQTAEGALDRVAVEWALVGPVARAAASGGDVTAALRDLAGQPGAGALRVVAAAWQVSHRTGHGLADALGRVADDLRAAEQTRRVVAGELASARATARLLAALPLAALAMGAGAGAAPWEFLLDHPAGLGCLAGGLALGYAGLSWVEALAHDIDRRT